MTTQASFALRSRNPDVLTCIANLSNDEVFTPPELANRMLDTLAAAWAADHNGADLWADPTVRFLDPCAKSGVFLREITSRLTKGLAEQMPELEARVNHILTQQVFGIAITHLTSLLARRSLYCSKHANGRHSIARDFRSDAGNIWFERLEHTWVNEKCKYCGANRRDYDRGEGLETHAYAFIHADDVKTRLGELFGGDMQFDVIIGNPPYQLGQSGGEAVGGFAMPIYQEFVKAAKSLDPRYVVMVTPSRWFAGGRGLDEYRSEVLADTRMRVLVDFPDAAEAFPGIQIKGGVSYFLWDNSWNDACEITTIHGGKPTSPPMKRYLGAYDVVVRRNEAVPILEKVLKVNAKDGFGNLASKVSPIQPFSIRTNFRGAETPKGMHNPVRLIRNGGEDFIERSEVPRNNAWIDEWKVLLGAAYGAGDNFPHQIYNYPIVASPGTTCTETYLVIDRFNSRVEADRFAAYLRTRFARFLVSLRKYTQHLYNERFLFVPDLPMDRDWTDEMLYQKYGITDDEVAFINSMIRPMGDDDD
ncbi:MAG: Eco57I restriction-modification methylase domain-containing protein [Caldilineaceae bacterium]|nr:Eco57I restriction-modification methylase domain-containing protein [Caldilineaceae bacterium]